MAERWCILRTSARRTWPLVESLVADGYEAWAPRGVPDQALRRPRRRSRKRISGEDLVPIMPTYVFARERHLDDLIGLAELREFSIMCDRMSHRGYAIIADASLDKLRQREDRSTPKPPAAPAEPFDHGEEIKVPVGIAGYAGMSGIVQSSDGKKTYLDFGGIMGRVEIETFRLRPEKLAA